MDTLTARLREISEGKESRIAHVYKTALEAAARIEALEAALAYAADVMERHGWHETVKDSAEFIAWAACRIEEKE